MFEADYCSTLAAMSSPTPEYVVISNRIICRSLESREHAKKKESCLQSCSRMMYSNVILSKDMRKDYKPSPSLLTESLCPCTFVLVCGLNQLSKSVWKSNTDSIKGEKEYPCKTGRVFLVYQAQGETWTAAIDQQCWITFVEACSLILWDPSRHGKGFDNFRLHLTWLQCCRPEALCFPSCFCALRFKTKLL